MSESIGTPVYDTEGLALVGEPGTVINVDFDGSVQSTLLTAGKQYLLQATKECCIAWGTNPTADTNDFIINPGVPYYFKWSTAVKVAAIKQSGGDAGQLQLLPMTRVG